MKRLLNTFGKLELIAFISGFSLMAFELVGARMIAPTIGSSTYVWTSVIGVIIAALSAGYFVGGKLADLRGYGKDVAFLCLSIAFAVACTLLLFDFVISQVTELTDDSRIRGVLASLLLFAPTSSLLGVLSPYLVKLKVTSLTIAGQSVAGLSAFNSIGGIVGTFVTGFIIFSYIGSHEALLAIVVCMLIASWLIEPRSFWKLRVGCSAVALTIVILPLLGQRDYVRVDTPTATYEVRTGWLENKPYPVRYLKTGPNGTQSGIFITQPHQLVFWYTREAARIVDLASSKNNILVLGGGAFTLPAYLAQKYPTSTVDVIEIDPALDVIAKQYFNLTSLENMHIIHDDARTYVNESTKQYDVVIVDVYNDNNMPFSLLTREYGERLRAITSAESTIIINTIAARQGPCLKLLAAIDATYRIVGGYASISQEDSAMRRTASNLILTYTKQPARFVGMDSLNRQEGSPYTDNFMPIEKLQQSCPRAS
jgi:predicted membrane-bound spermidine synthase